MSSNSYPPTDDDIPPSPSAAPQQVEWDYLTLPDDFNDFGFGADQFTQFPLPANLRNAKPFVHSHEPPPPISFPQPVIHPAIGPQSPIDGTYSLRTHPSSASGPSSSYYAAGGHATFAGDQNTTVPMSSMSGTVPIAMTAPAAAPFFSTSMHDTVPMSGSPVVGARAPVVRAWDAAAATAAGPSVPRTVPTFCRCRLRAHPFVHVGDKIEWVRPDLMRMDVWFNWSLNAEAEAHGWWGLPNCGCTMNV
ncbi:hypothetical protein EI94DRAFT_1795849 [Lactarius quietus]|nr:hypothetical protein EI94DRAFT_1795849 [Lactarius quietus]